MLGVEDKLLFGLAIDTIGFPALLNTTLQLVLRKVIELLFVGSEFDSTKYLSSLTKGTICTDGSSSLLNLTGV